MVFIVPIAQFYLTNAGRAAAYEAGTHSIDVQITDVAVGTAKYNGQAAAPAKTALTTEVARFPLIGGGINNGVLRFTTIFTPTISTDIFEIGLFLNDGTLFAVAAITGTEPLLQLVNGITGIITLGVALADITNATVTVDANSPISVALMNQHIEHSDPHPQYLQSDDISGKADKVTTITAGAGLTGGGDLSGNRIITLGTPSTITSWSGNEVSGSTHTHELGDGSVTDAKITNVSASKITGVIPSANLPPASAPVNVIDNLTSNSVNDALSANQGRVLAEQLADKLNLSGGVLTGGLFINNGADSASLVTQGSAIIGPRLILNEGNNEHSIGIPNNDPTTLIIRSPGGNFIFAGDNVGLLSLEVQQSDCEFNTTSERFNFNGDVYFGSVHKAEDGYTTLPNGLIMQWGRNINIIDVNATVTFPITFPNYCLNVIAVAENIDPNYAEHVNVDLLTTTSFRWCGAFGGGSTVQAVTNGYWMAIGY